MVELQAYRVVRELTHGAELRHYPAHDVVCVDVRGDFETAGYQGFGFLASYISGQNESGTRIAMTSPVLQQSADESQHTLCFVIPEMVALGGSPAPLSPGVKVEHRTAGLVAALGFRGTWRRESVKRATAQLRLALSESGLDVVGEPQYARYNPPSVPGFLRRNEVLIPVHDDL